MSRLISIVIPVYYNYDNLFPLYQDLKNKLLIKLTDLNYDYEIIMVDDGSRDKSYDGILDLKKIDNKIIAIKLSKNFGEHNAILAGFKVAKGDVSVVKTADIQEPTEMILEMLKEYEKGFEVVLAIRKDRKENKIDSFFSNSYYKVFKKTTGLDMPEGGFDTFLADKKVINVLVSLDEKNTTLMGLVLWTGFNTTKVYYSRLKREIGKSMWTFSKKVKLFEDSLYSFSIIPIKIISFIGFFFIVISTILIVYFILEKLMGRTPIQGFPTLVIIILLGFGIVLFSLGIIGEYIFRIFDATRKRPPYIISKIS